MKRLLLFLATNLAIVTVLSITLRVLGVEPYLTQQGLNLGSLLVFAAVFGMGGAFISLAISKWSAKRMTGAVPIETPATPIVMWFSRQREFRADAGGARLTHPPLDERIAALRRAAN